MKVKSQSLLFILLSIISLTFCQKHVPKIQVYIESLCPDCINFMTKSFKDFVERVSKPNLAQIELIPYGNAKEAYNETTQKWEFTCQHKENECYGNLMETCLIQKLGRIDSYKKILCLETNIEKHNANFDETLLECFDNDESGFNEIKDCMDSDLGNYYQHQMAEKTGEHDYVPWVLVDGEHDVDAEDQIIKSLIDYLCGDDKTKCYSE